MSKQAASGLVRASALGHCLRRESFRLLGYEPLPTPMNWRVLGAIGLAAEQEVLEILGDTPQWGPLTATGHEQQTFTLKDVVVARPDAIHSVTGQPWEIKTYGASASRRLGLDRFLKDGFYELLTSVLQQARPDHYIQVQATMAAMGKDTAMFVAVDRDTGWYAVPTPIYLDSNALSPRVADAEHVLEAVRSRGEPSHREYDFASWECKFCLWHQLCWTEEETKAAQQRSLNGRLMHAESRPGRDEGEAASAP